jgi:hypothetical protein
VTTYLTRYPANWKQISLDIRARAQNRCEWCGVENGADGARDLTGAFHTRQAITQDMYPHDWDRLFGANGEQPHYITIVLTVAHLGVPHPDGRPGDKHDKSDCRAENLAALCQRCHLNFDRADHLARSQATRERKRRERDAARGWVQLDLGIGV